MTKFRKHLENQIDLAKENGFSEVFITVPVEEAENWLRMRFPEGRYYPSGAPEKTHQ